MADQTDISQLIAESAPDTGEAQISQTVSEVGGSASAAQVSQNTVEIGASASSAQISELSLESGPNASAAIVSQLTIEFSRGPVTPFQVDTFRFNAGAEEINYYAAWQLSEGGAPKQDKEVRAVQPTGKFTNAHLRVYGYSQTEPIPITNIEDGINSVSGAIPLETVTLPQTLERVETNLSNLGMFTVRIDGTSPAVGDPDRIDKCEVEFQPLGMPR